MIKTYERHLCPECQSDGDLRYNNLKDRLFSAPGNWNLFECANSECGCLWSSPLPIEEELYKIYQNYYTHDVKKIDMKPSFFKKLYIDGCRAYYKKYFGYPGNSTTLHRMIATFLRLIPRRSAHLNFMAFHLPYREKGSLLEVGCGGGNQLQSMSDLGWQVHGIDIDQKAVDGCLARGLPASSQTLRELHAAGRKFDAIVMSHVIEHVHKPEDMIRQCYELLNPGGKLVLITPNVQSFSHKLLGKAWLPLDPPRHLTLFNMKSLSKIMKASGFDAESGSSIRFSDGSFVASLSIALTGQAKMNEYSRAVSWFAKVYQFLHFLAYSFSKKLGEELVMIGTKKVS